MSQPIRFVDAEGIHTVSDEHPLPVTSSNIASKDRDSFESYLPSSLGGTVWDEVKASGDIVVADGNTAGASYLVISKDPLSEGTESKITTIAEYHMPLDVAVGLSRSYAALGVEFAVEVVDAEVLPTPAAITATSIQQTTTTLSVTTAAAHGLVIGKRISVSGCSDSRLNYPSLVVATIPTATTFTCTAGPGGTIPSLSAGPVAGVINPRYSLGLATNGTSMIFENATATNASFYIRSEAGDALPSGTIAGNHAVTTGSTAPIALVSAANTYAWSPTTEFNLALQIDRLQWMDAGVDVTGQKSSRANRTQVIPSHTKKYKLRFRCTNNKSLTVPVAKIVSIAKAGSTTWTVVTASPHGLTVADYINIYGNRDTTNFPNLTTATVVASVIDATSFTVISTTGTATGYGGTVYRVQGGNLPSALGAISMVVQTISRTANVVTAVCSASVTGVSIGDYINIHGCRENVAGADIGLDGPYRVKDLATTTLTLEPIGNAPTGADVGSTNCGGTVIRRCDLRISYRRVWDYERLRVEGLARPASDAASALPVVVGNTPAVTISGTPAVTLSGTTNAVSGVAAHDAAISGNPHRIAGRARTSDYTTVANDDTADLKMTLSGAAVVYPYQIPELTWNYAAASAGIVNTTTAVTIKAAAGAGVRNYLNQFDLRWDTLGAATEFVVRDGASGTVIWRTKLQTAAGSHTPAPFNIPLKSTANTLLEVATLTASVTGGVWFNSVGYQAP